jgi:hypothetical protein
VFGKSETCRASDGEAASAKNRLARFSGRHKNQSLQNVLFPDSSLLSLKLWRTILPANTLVSGKAGAK